MYVILICLYLFWLKTSLWCKQPKNRSFWASTPETSCPAVPVPSSYTNKFTIYWHMVAASTLLRAPAGKNSHFVMHDQIPTKHLPYHQPHIHGATSAIYSHDESRCFWCVIGGERGKTSFFLTTTTFADGCHVHTRAPTPTNQPHAHLDIIVLM